MRAGVPVTLTVRSNEALLKPPEVTLRLDPALPPLDCQGSDSDYTCTYTATGAETEGPAPVDVRMMDLNRNEAVLKGAGTLVLDFTPPALAANSVSPPQSRFTTNIQVYFITSEALGAPARVTTSLPIEQADGGFQSVFDLLPEPSTTTSYRFEHEVTLADPDMPLSFYADLVDLAGHEAHVSLGSTVIDNVVPQIDGGSVTPLLANATATVVATFGVTKPVVGNPDVHVGPHVMQRDVNVQPPAYRYALALKGTEPEGPQGVVVSLRDAAGNEQLASIGTVTFDFTGPRVTSALVRYGAGQRVLRRVERWIGRDGGGERHRRRATGRSRARCAEWRRHPLVPRRGRRRSLGNLCCGGDHGDPRRRLPARSHLVRLGRQPCRSSASAHCEREDVEASSAHAQLGAHLRALAVRRRSAGGARRWRLHHPLRAILRVGSR